MSRKFVTFDQPDLAAFAVDTERRTITGLMVPWGQSARSQGRRWRFQRGSIKYPHLNRIKLLRDHDNGQLLGKCIGIEDTEAGLVGTFKVSPGRAGDDALALAVDEVLDGLSIGAEWRETDFIQDPLDPGGNLVLESVMRECSLTGVPAFDDSRLTSVRASDRGEPMNECERCGAQLVPGQAHTCQTNASETQPNQPAAPQQPNPQPQQPAEPAVTPAPNVPTPTPEQVPQQQPQGATFSADAVQQMLAAVMHGAVAGGGSIGIAPQQQPAVVNPTAQPVVSGGGAPARATFVAEKLPYRFTYQPREGSMPGGKHIFHAGQYDFSSDLFKFIDSNGTAVEEGKRVNALIRAAFDVDTTDGAGLMPARQRPDMYVPQMDFATPLWDMINSGGTDGEPFILPKYNSSSGLVVPATEGTEPAPGAFTVTTQTITPTQVWGKVEITRQAIRRGGNPQMSGMIWDQMLREYYEDREAAVATFLNTLTAAADITVTAGAGTNASDIISTAALKAAIARLQFARGGNRFRAFAVHQDLYKMLARVTDTSGRELFPQINPMNAAGSANSCTPR